MSVALLDTPPLLPLEGLVPYRRADCAALPDEPRCERIYGRFRLVDAVERQIEFLTLRDGSRQHQPPPGARYRSPLIPEVRIDLEAFRRSVEQRVPGETPSS